MIARLILPIPLALLAASCTAPISVDEGNAPFPPARVVPHSSLKSAGRIGSNPLAKVGPILDSLRTAADAIGQGNHEAIPEYNYLTGRLVEHLIEAGAKPWIQSVAIQSRSTDYLLRGTEPPDLRDPKRTFIPTDRLTFTGRYARNTGKTFGVGAPLVTFFSEDRVLNRSMPYRTVTAVVRFSGDQATIDLIDPFKVQEVTIKGRTLPLHADFNSPAAYFLSKERIDELGFARLMYPAAYDDTERLTKAQPYDPRKIPVLLIHGLTDTPASFAPMYFELMDDPAIRDRYQFWVFSYPSGYPYPMPAAALRDELDAIRRMHPDHKDIVIIGHSMGGLIARLMVTDVGEGIWRKFLGKSVADTEIKGKSRHVLEDALVFNARPDVSRVIFMSAPHRGSELATNFIGRIGVRLVHFPATLADMRDTFVDFVMADASGHQLDRFPSSIDTLSPTNRFIQAINSYPIRSDIPYHSIIGDRGHGDSPDSSDGVVAYWSSHLDGAASEKIIPSHHGSFQHPEGIEEVRRILHLHAGSPFRPKLNLEAPAETRSNHLLGRPGSR